MKWWKNNRDLDGVLKKVITENSDKMLDVNYYLAYTENKSKKDVDLVLYKLYCLRQVAGGTKSTLFKKLKDKVNDPNFGVKKETKSEPKIKGKK